MFDKSLACSIVHSLAALVEVGVADCRLSSLPSCCFSSRVVPLVALLPRERAAVGFLFAGGAEVAADLLLSALRPNLAQTLVVEEGLFRGAGVLPFSLRERVPGS